MDKFAALLKDKMPSAAGGGASPLDPVGGSAFWWSVLYKPAWLHAWLNWLIYVVVACRKNMRRIISSEGQFIYIISYHVISSHLNSVLHAWGHGGYWGYSFCDLFLCVSVFIFLLKLLNLCCHS